ncbi:MAG: carbohydrate porin [Pirellulaceae bacterium]
MPTRSPAGWPSAGQHIVCGIALLHGLAGLVHAQSEREPSAPVVVAEDEIIPPRDSSPTESGTGDGLPTGESATVDAPLPLPAHPDRPPLHYDHTLPPAAHASRAAHAPTVRRSSIPVPGRPSRSLPPPAEEPSEPADLEVAEETTAEDSARLGMLQFLPHAMGPLVGQYTYTGEVFSLAHGGLDTNQATQYRGLLDVTLELDTAGAGWWEQGRFFLYGFSAHGRTLSADYVGDLQLYSNIDTAPFAETLRIGEAYYEHNWAEGMWRAKVGLLDANADFAISDLGASFLGASFVMPPTIPLVTWPLQRFGGVAFLRLNDELVLAGGLFDIGENIGQFGFDSVGHLGALTLVQLEWQHTFGAREDLPNTTRIGGWSVNGTFQEISGTVPENYEQNGGGWVSVDQMIWNEGRESPTDQGLSVFVQYGWAPADRNQLSDYYGGGIVYKGLIATRDADLCGIAVGGPQLSHRMLPAGTTDRLAETSVEMFYRIQVGEFVSVQPDAIYVATPSGDGRDALLVGCRCQIVL